VPFHFGRKSLGLGGLRALQAVVLEHQENWLGMDLVGMGVDLVAGVETAHVLHYRGVGDHKISWFETATRNFCSEVVLSSCTCHM